MLEWSGQSLASAAAGLTIGQSFQLATDEQSYGFERLLNVMSGEFGVAGMVKCAAMLGEDGVETESMGREAFDRKDSCTWIACGKNLCFRVVLDGGWVNLSVQLMDIGDEPELLATFADGPSGWHKMHSLISALECSKVRSLRRPIEAGEGVDGWVIG